MHVCTCIQCTLHVHVNAGTKPSLICPVSPSCSHGCGRSLAVKWALSVSINFMIHLGAGLPQAGLWLPLNL